MQGFVYTTAHTVGEIWVNSHTHIISLFPGSNAWILISFPLAAMLLVSRPQQQTTLGV